MDLIKKHYFRLNIKGIGYCLLTKCNGAEIESHPLDLITPDIPSNYIAIQHVIDNTFENDKIYLTVSLQRELGKTPMVAYGCKIDAKDEYGRPGISFIHSVEMFDSNNLYELVLNIVRLFSQSSIEVFIKRISDLAVGQLDPKEIIEFLIKKVERNIGNNSAMINQYDNLDFNLIRHDCSGAAPIAWLTFASFLNGKTSYWSVNDTFNSNLANIITRLKYEGTSDKMLSASEILSSNILSNYKEQIILQTVEENVRNIILPDISKKKEDFHESEKVPVENKTPINPKKKIDTKPISFKDKIIRIFRKKQKKENLENEETSVLPDTFDKQAILGLNGSKINQNERLFVGSDKTNGETFIFRNNIVKTCVVIFILLSFVSIFLSYEQWKSIKTSSFKSKNNYLKIIKDLKDDIYKKEKELNTLNTKSNENSNHFSMRDGLVFYHVSENESLSSIAQTCGVSEAQIKSLNPNDITEDSSVRDGAKLLIKR